MMIMRCELGERIIFDWVTCHVTKTESFRVELNKHLALCQQCHETIMVSRTTPRPFTPPRMQRIALAYQRAKKNNRNVAHAVAWVDGVSGTSAPKVIQRTRREGFIA